MEALWPVGLVMWLNEVGLALLERAVILSMIVTVVHTFEEIVAPRGPLWDQLGDRVGVRPSYWVGFLSFMGLTWFSVFAAGHAWEYGDLRWAGVLFGVRSGDFLFSHVLPTVRTRQVNPGFRTGWLYLAEAVCLSQVHAELDSHLGWAVLGAAPFALIWLLGVWGPFRPRPIV